MSDRLDAVGGTLEIRSAEGKGTTVEGWVRMDQAAEEAASQADSSLSGPNAAFGM
jgi:hypothetical protein